MYFVHTCIIIILAFSFFNGSLSQKKIVKVIEDDIYDKLLEILKGSEKFVLAKFYSNVDKKIWRLISNKNVKAKDKFNIVTGQTEFRLVGWSFIKQYFFENFQSSRSQIFWKMVLLNISQNLQENICAAVFFDRIMVFQSSSSATVIFLWTLQFF